MEHSSATSLLAPILMILGLVLIALGLGWQSVAPPSAYWTDAQADEFVAAQQDLHRLTDDHGRSPSHERDFQAARQRFERISSDLHNARSARGRTGTYICAAGVLFVLIGIGIHFVGKSAD